MRTWMKLVIGILITVPLLAGCDSSSGGDDPKDDDAKARKFFIGEWHVTDAGVGGFYITFAEDGNLIMADYRGGPAHLKGTWAVDGETAVGPLKNPGVGTAEFIATPTGDDTMLFEFIEHWGPGKHIPLNGVKL
ncbi:MAG: hypothetical protein WAQ74_05505 [Kiritimatiellia bacterium]|jgi:hypothetical protein